MDNGKYAEKALETIISMVVKEFDYFRDNPKHLAWVMMNYSLIHISGRIAYDACWENPKYPVIDAGEELETEEDGNLLYDAWGVSVSNSAEFPDPAREPLADKLAKPNKTLDEWIDVMIDPKYRYSSLYSSEKSVINTLLCVIGTGMGWNEAGFVTHTGPSGVDEDVYTGYTLVEPEVRKDISSAINKLLSHPSLKGPTDDYMKKVKINWGSNEVEKTIVNGSPKVTYDLRDDPELMAKAQEAYQFIAYLEKLVKVAGEWDDDQWAKASKKSTWKCRDYMLDISRVQPSSIYSTFTFESDLRMRDGAILNSENLTINDGVLGARSNVWSSFVYANDGHPDVKKAQAVFKLRFTKNEPSKKKMDKATKMLRKHQPNHAKYGSTYASACAGDKKAIETLDKLTNMPKHGWDSVRFLVDHKRKQRESLSEFYGPEKKNATYYPLSDYSNMIRMPDNAHSSYIKAGLKVAQEVIDNKEERPDSRKYAKKFLKKWQSKK